MTGRRRRTRDRSGVGGGAYFPWVNIFLLLCSSSLVMGGDLVEECINPNRRQAAVQFRGEVILVNEDNFPKHVTRYPPPKDTASLDSTTGPEYFILHQDKPILYVPNFLNETSVNELKEICISNQRFTRSPIRGHGEDLSVAHSDIRTRYERLIANVV